jgi:apolipoprotein N-acyltransferase
VTYVGLRRFELMDDVMRGYRYAFAAGPGYFTQFMSFMGVLGIIFGAIIILGAVMLNRKPGQHQTWGVIILIFGGMAGYLVGLILGIVGGALAIAWNPPQNK